MFLSSYQRAILQEMGLPVFVEKSSLADVPQPDESIVTPAVSAPVSVPAVTLNQEEKQARLSALRQAVSTNKPEPKVVESTPLTPTPPKTRSLTEQESSELALFLSDVVLAANQCGLELTEKCLVVGDDLQVSATQIVLPKPPLLLSTENKKALWKKLTQLAN